MNVYVIGDVQGCSASLLRLLELIHQETTAPQLIFLGDLINRGPGSLETLRLIKDLGDRATALLGNHDLHLLAASQNQRKPHPFDTFQDILNAPDREELLDWLRYRPLAHYQAGYLMVHAGVVPQWDAQQTLALAQEVEGQLRSPGWRDFLSDMYGNQPAKWSDQLNGIERLRCIVNALTRIRFCTVDGTMDFEAKESAASAPPGTMPWFDVPGRRTAATPIIFGHWSTLGLVMRPDLIALDTGCVWGGKLSAVRLEDRKIVQVDCPQYRAPG